MTQDQNAPPAAIVGADQPTSAPAARAPTLRERLRTGRWLGLKASDWGASSGLIILAAAGAQLLLTAVQGMQPQRRLWGELLLICWATLAGAILVYSILRRMISDLGLGNRSLLDLSHETIGESRHLIDQARSMIERAYTIGQAEGRAGWQALATAADAAQARVDELERQLAEHQRPLPFSEATLARLRAEIERLTSDTAQLDRKAEDLPAQTAALNRRLDQMQADIDALRRRATLDAMDQRILNLLSRDPQPSDKQISQITRLSESQVLRRRQKMAAAGYPAAQKRQGQRKRPHPPT